MSSTLFKHAALLAKGELAHGTHGTQQHRRSLRRVVLQLSCIKIAEECLIRLEERKMAMGNVESGQKHFGSKMGFLRLR